MFMVVFLMWLFGFSKTTPVKILLGQAENNGVCRDSPPPSLGFFLFNSKSAQEKRGHAETGRACRDLTRPGRVNKKYYSPLLFQKLGEFGKYDLKARHGAGLLLPESFKKSGKFPMLSRIDYVSLCLA